MALALDQYNPEGKRGETEDDIQMIRSKTDNQRDAGANPKRGRVNLNAERDGGRGYWARSGTVWDYEPVAGLRSHSLSAQKTIVRT